MSQPLALLGPCALGNVSRHEADLRVLACRSPDDAAFRFDMAEAAVGQEKAKFGPPPDARFDCLAEDRLDALAVLGVDLLEGVRSRLDPVVGEDAPPGRAVVDAPALGVAQGDQVSAAFGDRRKPPFAFA